MLSLSSRVRRPWVVLGVMLAIIPAPFLSWSTGAVSDLATPARSAPAAPDDADLTAELARLDRAVATVSARIAELQANRDAASADLSRLAAFERTAAARIADQRHAGFRALRLLRRLRHTQLPLPLVTAPSAVAGVRGTLALEGLRRTVAAHWRDLGTAHRDRHTAGARHEARHRDFERATADLVAAQRQQAALTAEIERVRARLAIRPAAPAQVAPGQNRGDDEPSAAFAAAPPTLAGTIGRPPALPPSRRPDRPKPEAAGRSMAPVAATADQATPVGWNPVVLPVVGQLVTPFGTPSASPHAIAGRLPGVRYRTAPDAVVRTPAEGRVAFAGPFRGYGLLLIVEHDDRYHSLLAGLASTHVSTGDVVVVGKSLGTMPSGTHPQPVLYYELRFGGQPINPLPWLTAATNEVDE